MLSDFLAGNIPRPAETLPALSMFSNAGVGDFGYRQAGFTFHVHAEIIADRLGVCKLNHPGSAAVLGDLNDTWEEVVDAYHDKCERTPKLLTAMPPCQGMSSASNAARAGASDEEPGSKASSQKKNRDPRNLLSFLVARVAAKLRPEFVVLENVPGILYTRVEDPDTGTIGSVAQLLAKKMREPQRKILELVLDVDNYVDDASQLGPAFVKKAGKLFPLGLGQFLDANVLLAARDELILVAESHEEERQFTRIRVTPIEDLSVLPHHAKRVNVTPHLRP